MTDLLQKLKDARRRCEEAAIGPGELPADSAAAYALALSDPARVAAWKIGGANPWSRVAIGNQEVFFGALYEDEFFVETASVPAVGLYNPLAEPEIMLEIADPAAGTPEAAFSRMGMGFEIPATVLPEGCKQLLAGQIADRAGAGALWVGAVKPFDMVRLRSPFASEFRHNDTAPVAGHSENVLGGPLAAAANFLALARRHGAPLAAGQWIASGGLNPAVTIKTGDTLRFAALGAEVRVEIS